MAVKRVSIKLLGDAKEAYLVLKKLIEDERKKGILKIPVLGFRTLLAVVI